MINFICHRKVFLIMKKLYCLVLVAAIAGLGITTYWSLESTDITAHGAQLTVDSVRRDIDMNTSSVYVDNITISCNEEAKNVHVKVLPGNKITASNWGEDFVAYPDRSEVDLTAANNNSTEVTIIYNAIEEGRYRIKVITMDE